MAIGGSGLYAVSLEKFFIDSAGESLEAEDHNGYLVEDGYTPAYDTHEFHDDLTNEISGGNYAAEPTDTTEVTIAGEVLTYDHANTVYDNGGSNDVTITDAMAQVQATNVSGTATDQLVYLLDFVTAASCTNSTFTVEIHANGVFTLDFVP